MASLFYFPRSNKCYLDQTKSNHLMEELRVVHGNALDKTAEKVFPQAVMYRRVCF